MIVVNMILRFLTWYVNLFPSKYKTRIKKQLPLVINPGRAKPQKLLVLYLVHPHIYNMANKPLTTFLCFLHFKEVWRVFQIRYNNIEIDPEILICYQQYFCLMKIVTYVEIFSFSYIETIIYFNSTQMIVFREWNLHRFAMLFQVNLSLLSGQNFCLCFIRERVMKMKMASSCISNHIFNVLMYCKQPCLVVCQILWIQMFLLKNAI